ncbi:MAG: HEAT repeat domain-containing protein [Verrucomicrobiota bacterium]|jgi:hypothetical protein|nr:HEAT repeat domain-containing protein [Verrucomicrobiota bacterium]
MHRVAILIGCVLGPLIDAATKPLPLKPGDHVVFIGNTFAVRMGIFGHFETFLHCRFPEHKLTVRNLGWPADEITRLDRPLVDQTIGNRKWGGSESLLMPRPKGFGNLHKQLKNQKADLILACFGMNESFAGESGLAKFEADLDAFVRDLQAQRFNERTPPRIVLVSPIAHEQGGQARNANLAQYTFRMKKVAAARSIPFVDLFAPTREWMAGENSKPLTFNGIHLTEFGDWVVSHMLAEALGMSLKKGKADAATAALRRLVHDKNRHFSIHWRGPNAEYIHGERNRMPGSIKLPEEMAEYGKLIAQQDRRIWQVPKPAADSLWAAPPRGRPIWATQPKLKAPKFGPTQKMGRTQLLGPEAALKQFKVAPGYAVNLFASEIKFPLANPMALKFDARGRLWVANTPTWPQPVPGVAASDSIIILEDTDHDGRADKHTVFIDGLHMIHGFALGHGGAYISQTPQLIFAADTNGDDRGDEFRMLLHGFGAEDVEHSMNNFEWGPDGALYFMEGIFFHTQVETPFGPRRMRDGGVFRYEPHTHRFDPFVSHRFSNPWGLVFDKTGQGIVLDASPGHFYNLNVLSANYRYPKPKIRNVKLSFAPGGVGPASGIGRIHSRHFPPEAQGRFLSNQLAGMRATHWFDLEEAGNGYKAKRIKPDLLSSSDPYHRPVAMTFGPDGALYIADFYSPVIENTSYPKRHPGRDHTRGRIWRITAKGRPLLKQPQIEGRSVAELLELLKEHEPLTRHFARRELQERKADSILPSLNQWLMANKANEQMQLEALWIYQGLNVRNPELLQTLLTAKDAHVRAAAVRVLRQWQGGVEDAARLLRKLVEDRHPRVRLEAVLACGFSNAPDAVEIAQLASGHPLDEGLRHALNETLRYHGRKNAAAGKPTSQRKDGSIVLRAGRAVVHGDSLAFEEENQNLGFWTNANDWCEFEFKVNHPGTFIVSIDQACAKDQSGSTVTLAVDNQNLVATVQNTGSWNRFKIVEAGKLQIKEAGTHVLSMKPLKKMHSAIMDLRSIMLKPVEPK